ncbi:MAG: spore maturation protein A [Clostridia bacterium]|nr:spore maturation protein A [Clostridia bacterium]MBQ7348316.1 spore maturation protein A [Clostridia bacterium]
MLGKIFGIMSIIAFFFGIFTGNTEALGSAVLDGAARALEVTLSLCGMMCLWCGMMRVLQEAGAIRRLSCLLAPFLRVFFPEASQSGEGVEEISANISANLLGIGNAATPFALAAMEKMQKHNPHPARASAEQITLAVLNTASVSLIPANLLALRRAAGSERPYAVMIPVWISSILCASMALLLTSLPRLWERKGNTVKGDLTASRSHGKRGHRG